MKHFSRGCWSKPSPRSEHRSHLGRAPPPWYGPPDATGAVGLGVAAAVAVASCSSLVMHFTAYFSSLATATTSDHYSGITRPLPCN